VSFEERIGALERRASRVELAVLVWGPGEGGGEHYEKRLEVRERLKAHFANADVRFSEELSAGSLPSGAEHLSAPEQELWHLRASDVCVVLDTAKGSGEEIARFSGTKEAYKLLVLTHECYRDAATFPGSIRSGLKQIFYTDEEYTSCSVVGRVVHHVRQVALDKLIWEG
jgi:hypothetical protein